MRLIGHGIDIVDVARVERLLTKFGDDFLLGWFTVREITGVPAGPEGQAMHLAARLAAKEAVVKALGTGFIGAMTRADIEILPLASGAPMVVLSGETQRIATERGITDWLLSLAHTDDYAVASAIAVGSGPQVS